MILKETVIRYTCTDCNAFWTSPLKDTVAQVEDCPFCNKDKKWAKAKRMSWWASRKIDKLKGKKL
jgi:hypothetical protein